MKSALLNDANGLRTFAVVMDKGDEAAAKLQQFAREHDIAAASLTAVGGFEQATLAYFDRVASQYLDIAVNEQVEVLSLIGDVALNDDDQAQVHAHCVVGHRDGTTAGGHLKAGTVWPTLEVVVTELPVHLHKRFDPETGLALLAL